MRNVFLVLSAAVVITALVAASCAGPTPSSIPTTNLPESSQSPTITPGPSETQTPNTPAATFSPPATPISAHVVTVYSAPG
jgi:hypothetical protein